MNRNEIFDFITMNRIDENSLVVFTIIENGQEVMYNGKFEFFSNGTPAISDDRVGIRIQMVRNASYTPYVGGLLFENLINIIINE